MKFLDYPEENQKLGCRKLSKSFQIWKTAAANILKSKKNYVKSTSSFMRKKNKNTFDLEDTSLSMTFDMTGTKILLFQPLFKRSIAQKLS